MAKINGNGGVVTGDGNNLGNMGNPGGGTQMPPPQNSGEPIKPDGHGGSIPVPGSSGSGHGSGDKSDD